MPNIKSAKKRSRQNVKRKIRNKSVVSAIKTVEKKLLKALPDEAGEKAQELLKTYTSKISKAKSKGIIKATKASRKISRISKKVFKAIQDK